MVFAYACNNVSFVSSAIAAAFLLGNDRVKFVRGGGERRDALYRQLLSAENFETRKSKEIDHRLKSLATNRNKTVEFLSASFFFLFTGIGRVSPVGIQVSRRNGNLILDVSRLFRLRKTAKARRRGFFQELETSRSVGRSVDSMGQQPSSIFFTQLDFERRRMAVGARRGKSGDRSYRPMKHRIHVCTHVLTRASPRAQQRALTGASSLRVTLMGEIEIFSRYTRSLEFN